LLEAGESPCRWFRRRPKMKTHERVVPSIRRE
jgi:hypothetical protein